MLKEQLLSDEFKEVTGGKIFSKLVLFTDSALNDSCHMLFILQHNSQNKIHCHLKFKCLAAVPNEPCGVP